MLKSNKMLKITLILITILSILMLLGGNIFASGASDNGGVFDVPTGASSELSGKATSMGSILLGLFQAVGTVVAVVILVWLGIKYIMASPDGKAEIKKQAFGYILGAVLLFGAVWIVPLIQSLVNSMQ